MTGVADAAGRPGTRSRAGNAMGRTRTSLLTAAATCLARQGVRQTTMADVAAEAGVAKATLYNHVRTKDEVLAALVLHEIGRLGQEAAAAPTLAAALATAARGLSEHPALRRLVAEEPAVLGPLLRGGTGPGWRLARSTVADLLGRSGAAAETARVDTVLRWLLGAVLLPGLAEDAERGAQVLAAGLLAGTGLQESVPT